MRCSARAPSPSPAPRACFAPRCPKLGSGFAVKADDGAGRAAQVMIAALIVRFGGFDDGNDSAP